MTETNKFTTKSVTEMTMTILQNNDFLCYKMSCEIDTSLIFEMDIGFSSCNAKILVTSWFPKYRSQLVNFNSKVYYLQVIIYQSKSKLL